MVKLYAIDLGYATYGIFVENDIVVDAPPIARWMIGKQLKKVQMWVECKKSNIVKVEENRNEC